MALRPGVKSIGGFTTYTGNIVGGGKGATGNVAPLNAKAKQNNAKKSGGGKPGKGQFLKGKALKM